MKRFKIFKTKKVNNIKLNDNNSMYYYYSIQYVFFFVLKFFNLFDTKL